MNLVYIKMHIPAVWCYFFKEVFIFINRVIGLFEPWIKIPSNIFTDYFTHLVDRGNLYGVYAGGRLVSAADLPDVPHMADIVAEPGIATLAAYWRRGYAKAAAGALLKHLLAQGKTPLWSCAATNTASDRLARSVGFDKIADVIAVTREQATT